MARCQSRSLPPFVTEYFGSYPPASVPFHTDQPPRITKWTHAGELLQAWSLDVRLTTSAMQSGANYTWCDSETEKQFYLRKGARSHPIHGIYQLIDGNIRITDIYNASINVPRSSGETFFYWQQPRHRSNGTLAVSSIDNPGVSYDYMGYARRTQRRIASSIVGGARTVAYDFNQANQYVPGFIGPYDFVPRGRFNLLDNYGASGWRIYNPYRPYAPSGSDGAFFFGEISYVYGWYNNIPSYFPVYDYEYMKGLMYLQGNALTLCAHWLDFVSYWPGMHSQNLLYSQPIVDGANGTVLVFLGGRVDTSVPLTYKAFVCDSSGILNVYDTTIRHSGPYSTINTLAVFDNNDLLQGNARGVAAGTEAARVSLDGTVVTRYSLQGKKPFGGFVDVDHVYLFFDALDPLEVV